MNRCELHRLSTVFSAALPGVEYFYCMLRGPTVFLILYVTACAISCILFSLPFIIVCVKKKQILYRDTQTAAAASCCLSLCHVLILIFCLFYEFVYDGSRENLSSDTHTFKISDKE